MSNIRFNEPLKYKEVCEMLEDEFKSSGRSRNLQLKRWQKEYEINKEGTYYTVIRKLSEEEKREKVIVHYKDETHHIRNKEKYKQFHIHEADRHKAGIYKIELDKTIYIGQTNDFYNRFRQHYYSDLLTRNLLEKGAIFSIIERCDSQEKRDVLEKEYIQKYCKDKDYKCINKDFTNNSINKKKYKYIKLNYRDWKEIKKILDERGFEYYDK